MKASLTLTCSLALLCLAVVSVTIAADVPQLINVQGKLTDVGGDPVADGPYSVLFSIYDVVTGGTALWHETRTVTVSDGLFSISLGESTTIPPSLFDNTDLWLGIKVESDAEMTPRQRLTTSPYAFRVAGSSVGGGWVDDGSVVRLETSSDKVGIGTTSPEAQLHVKGGYGVNDGIRVTNLGTQVPALGFFSKSDFRWGICSSTGWGDLNITQYDSNWDRIGLRFIIREDGKVGIGTNSPTQALEVAGTVYSTSGGFKFPDGTVQTTAAVYGGPIAYGVIASNGTVSSATGNVSCSWSATSDRYQIVISGESYDHLSYVTVVTPCAFTPITARTGSVSDQLLVFMYNSSGEQVQAKFSFVTYKP